MEREELTALDVREDGEYVDYAASGDRGSARPLLLELLVRYRWTIAGVTLLLTVLGVLLVYALFDPKYRATAIVQIHNRKPTLLVEDDRGRPHYEMFVHTQAEIMRSAVVLRRAVAQPEVIDCGWLSEEDRLNVVLGITRTPEARLGAALEVAPQRHTELVHITVSSTAPDHAATLANAVLDAYMLVNDERLTEDDRELQDILRREETEVTRELQELDDRITRGRIHLRALEPQEIITQRRLELEKLQSQLDDVEMNLKHVSHQRDQLAGTTTAEGAAPDPLPPDVLFRQDRIWLERWEAVARARRALDEAEARYGPRNEQRLTAERDLQFEQQQLAQREDELRSSAEMGVPLAPSDGGVRSLAELDVEIEALKSQKGFLADRIVEYRRSFDRDFEAAKDLQESLDRRKERGERLAAIKRALADIQEKAIVPAGIVPLTRAEPPLSPNDDKRLKLAVAAVFGALAAGFGVAWLLHATNPHVREAAEALPAAEGVFLGFIPMIDGRAQSCIDPPPVLVEAIRMTRTALLARLGRREGRGGHVLQVTSAGPGSGKSTYAMNLARSCAQCGMRTLLVDADVYRGALSKYFEVPRRPGLSEVLSGEMDLARARHDFGPLTLLTSGSFDPAQVEALASGSLARLLERWRSDHDVVIVDTPPLLASADAGILSAQVDGTVMVVRERHCRRHQLTQALSVLGAAGGRLIGTIFVGRVHATAYPHYYSYVSPPSLPPRANG